MLMASDRSNFLSDLDLAPLRGGARGNLLLLPWTLATPRPVQILSPRNQFSNIMAFTCM